MITILAADDERLFCDMLCAALQTLSANVIGSYDSNDAWNKIKLHQPQLLILDVTMPPDGGLYLLKRIRADRKINAAYVIMLTARSSGEEIVLGLESGADDYITKPFELRELFARVRAGLRRLNAGKTMQNTAAQVKGLRLFSENFTAYIDDYLLHLTPIEFSLLEIFLRNSRRVLSREYLIVNAVGCDSDSGSRTIDTHINNIRKKLNCEPLLRNTITAIRGIGYRFDPPDNYEITIK